MSLVGDEKRKIRIYEVPVEKNSFFSAILSSIFHRKLTKDPECFVQFSSPEIFAQRLLEFTGDSNLFEAHCNLIEAGKDVDGISYENYMENVLSTGSVDNFIMQITSDFIKIPILIFELKQNDTVLEEVQEFLPSGFELESTLENSCLTLSSTSNTKYKWISMKENIHRSPMDSTLSPLIQDSIHGSVSLSPLEEFCQERNINAESLKLEKFENFDRLMRPGMSSQNPSLSPHDLNSLIKILWKSANFPSPMARDSLNSTNEYSMQPWFLTQNPKFKLMQFQIESVNKLRSCWKEEQNFILGDEQGLGKTVQTIIFLRSLIEEGDSSGPFFVAVPLSTLENWQEEFVKWAPELKVIIYKGSPASREKFRSTQLNSEFHVLLITYDLIKMDSKFFSHLKFEALIVDEGHNLKNPTSQLLIGLQSQQSKFKLLLTGTPFQNSISDFFTQLHFLDAKSFDNRENFLSLYKDLTNNNSREDLKRIIKSRMLRRTADEVLELEPLKILSLRVELTNLQKILYKSLEKPNSAATTKLFKPQSGPSQSLLNPDMQRQKIVNHPLLFTKYRQDALGAGKTLDPDMLINSSGKMIILQKLLKFLKDGKHRVLIFNLMTKMMDLLGNFLDNEGYDFTRMDGQTDPKVRQKLIKDFNCKKSNSFVFLLNTLSGGVGLNLQGADTVIIFESHFNPQNDLQSIKRVHRIGQEKPVLVIRLITNSGIEEKVQHFDSRKLAMSKILTSDGNDDHLLSILDDTTANLDSLNKIIDVTTDTDFTSLLDRSAPQTMPNSLKSALTSCPDFDPNLFVCMESGKPFRNASNLKTHRMNFYPFHKDFEHLFTGWLIHPKDLGVWTNPGQIQLRDFDPVKDTRAYVHYLYYLNKFDVNGKVVERLVQTGYTLEVHSIHSEAKNRAQKCLSLLAALDPANAFTIDWNSFVVLGYSDYLGGSTSIADDMKWESRTSSPFGNYHNLFLDHPRVSTQVKKQLLDRFEELGIPRWITHDPIPQSFPPFPRKYNPYYSQVLSARKAFHNFIPRFPGDIFEYNIKVVHPPKSTSPSQSNPNSRPQSNPNSRPTSNPTPESNPNPNSRPTSNPTPESKSNPTPESNPNPTPESSPNPNSKSKSHDASKKQCRHDGCENDARPCRTECNQCRKARMQALPKRQCKTQDCDNDVYPGLTECLQCRNARLKALPTRQCKTESCENEALVGRNYCQKCKTARRKAKNNNSTSTQKIDGPSLIKKRKLMVVSSSESDDSSE